MTIRAVITILLFLSYNINLKCQDVLSEYGLYTDQPHDIAKDRDFVYLINSKRIYNNRIKKCVSYNYKMINELIIDSSINYSVEYYKSGFDSALIYSNGKSIISKNHSILNFNRDSIIQLDSIEFNQFKAKKKKEKSGFCKLIKWYNDYPRVTKTKNKCGIFGTKNTYHEMIYNEKGLLIKATRKKGRFFFRKEFLWCVNYIYDENGNLIELYTTDENGNKKGGQKFYYEYWE